MLVKITAPISAEDVNTLKVGDRVLLSGVIFTGRDAAHKRMVEMLENGESLPFDINGQIIYYTGPCPAPPGHVIGSAGPTTSTRMDAYSPRLIEEGLRFMIGKGSRNKNVTEAICNHSGLYFSAIGGAGALMSFCVKDAALIAFDDLGTEAVYKLTVHDMPLIVAVDSNGDSLYK